MSGAQLRDELGGVERGIVEERGGDSEEGGGEGADGELFARALAVLLEGAIYVQDIVG